MANEVQRVRQAIVAMVAADATLVGLMGRSTDMIRVENQLNRAPMPMLVFGKPAWDGRSQQMVVTFAANAEDVGTTDADAIAQALLAQLEVVINAVGFKAQGMDVVPLAFDRTDGDVDPEGSPTLTIAEATATLLVLA